MLLIADGCEREGFALVDPETHELVPTELCDDEAFAHALRMARIEHQPQRGVPAVVPVLVSVRRV